MRTMDDRLLIINGSFGEGGGSIVRLSSAYSLLFNQRIKITNIRANRPKKGLQLQHLLGLKTLAEFSGINVSDCDVGTTELSILPKRDKIKDHLKIKVGTAASIGLLLQPIQIAAMGLRNGETIKIEIDGGGTFGKWAPSLDYLMDVTYRIFRSCGLDIEIQIFQHGFYPKGGAKLNCVIRCPADTLKPIRLTEIGKIGPINGRIIISNQIFSSKAQIAQRVEKTIKEELAAADIFDSDIKYQNVSSLSPGLGLHLWTKSDKGAIISSGTLLGEKGISSEQIGIIAVKEILKYLQNRIPVDNYLSDQLIPLMSIANGVSEIKVLEVTSHAITNIKLIEQFIGKKFNIEKKDLGYLIQFNNSDDP
jgi:RNA 3'-phosphate cyclase